MPMKPALVLPLLLALMACATPKERCITNAAPDLPVLDALIAETQGNLARGYAYADVVVQTPVWVECAALLSDGTYAAKPKLCMGSAPTTLRKAVAIDLTAEADKLASMQARRAAMEAQAQPAFAQCQAQFPK
jgi:hypothetical protein